MGDHGERPYRYVPFDEKPSSGHSGNGIPISSKSNRASPSTLQSLRFGNLPGGRQMRRRRRGATAPGSPPRHSAMLSLVNRFSAAGTAVVVLVGVALAAIVEQTVLPGGDSLRSRASHG